VGSTWTPPSYPPGLVIIRRRTTTAGVISRSTSSEVNFNLGCSHKRRGVSFWSTFSNNNATHKVSTILYLSGLMGCTSPCHIPTPSPIVPSRFLLLLTIQLY